jgi:hypothetical protein
MLTTELKVLIAYILPSAPILVLAPAFYPNSLWQECFVGWLVAVSIALVLLLALPRWRKQEQFWLDRALATRALDRLEHHRLPYFDRPLLLAKPISHYNQLAVHTAVANVRKTISQSRQLINGSIKERGLKVKQIPALVEHLVKELDAVLAYVSDGVGDRMPALADRKWFDRSDVLGKAMPLFPDVPESTVDDSLAAGASEEIPNPAPNVIAVDFRLRKRVA